MTEFFRIFPAVLGVGDSLPERLFFLPDFSGRFFSGFFRIFLNNYEVTKRICPLGVKPIDIGVGYLIIFLIRFSFCFEHIVMDCNVSLIAIIIFSVGKFGIKRRMHTPGLANGIRTGCGIWAYAVDVFAQPTPDWTLVGAIKGLRFFE